MKPIAIAPETTTRAAAFSLWMDAPNPMVTFFKTLDVTPLLRLSRRRGYKFNMLLCWCIGKATSEIKEFYLLPVGHQLLQYDSIAVNTIVKNRTGEVSSCDVPFSDDLALFNADYLRLTRETAESCGNHDLTERMVIGTSAIVDTEIDGAVGMNSGIFNNPFLIWGSYRKGVFRTTLPLSFQFHHTDGWRTCRAVSAAFAADHLWIEIWNVTNRSTFSAPQKIYPGFHRQTNTKFLTGELFETYHFITGACGLTGRSGKSIHTPFLPERKGTSSGGTNMNRENKRKTFEKGYYKTHACRDSFTCKVCDRLCTPESAGSDHRNHCPNCLSSLHVDIEPGDRASDCGGIMEPIAVWVRKGGEWAIIHRCKRCGALSSNRVAADDNPMKLMSIAMKPLCEPPFPLERIEEMTHLMAGDGRMS